MFGKIFLSILLLSFLKNSYSHDICTKHLHFLAEQQKLFLFCATVHAVPVDLCIGCEKFYGPMNKAYKDLRDEVNCTAKYFDKDRINIVQTTQTILVGLWTKAFCEDCFNGDESKNFADKQQHFHDCIAANKNNECLACMVKYEDLNNFYTDLDVKQKGQICYDMQDMMNRTRALWSDTYDCCKRVVNLNLFAVAVSIVLILPIIFYGFVFALEKRNETNYDTLLNTDTEASTSTAPIVSGNIENLEPSSSRQLTTEVNNTYSVRLTVAAENPSHESLKVSKLTEYSSDSDDAYDTKKYS